MIVPEALEFDRIRRLVAAEARSEAAVGRILRQEPSTDEAELRGTLHVVEAMARRIAGGTAGPGGSAPDLRPAFEALSVEGAQLEPDQLGSFVAVASLRSEYLAWLKGDDLPDELRSLLEGFAAPEPLLAEVARHITPSGEIVEKALPELARFRSLIAENYRRLQRESASLMREAGNRYRESGATIRDGRTVLPLSANFRGRVEGIVHELSGSGNTVFVEPPELVVLNNERVALENEIHMVIRALIRRLSRALRSEADALARMHEHLVSVDTLYARARYSIAVDGRRPDAGAAIHVERARHPLLGATCVPVDVDFPEDTRVLVVSGPNTGGKTVLLKTLGLIAAMHQFGLLVPVGEGSVLPVFDYIGVDVGDAQSIDRSLSTFSAHLRTLAEIIDRATPRSLVLLDELGTGTDPDEAAALTTAYVDRLLEISPFALITTHQTVLKHYGYTHEGVQNASMEYDRENHRPTYRVISGTPGSSYAIDTAEQQGFPTEIVRAARAYSAGTHTNVAEIIARLTEREKELDGRLIEARRVEEEAEERRRVLEQREARIAAEELELRREGLRELRTVAQEARKSVEKAVRELRETERRTDDAEAEGRAREKIRAVEERVSAEESRVLHLTKITAGPDPETADEPIGPGDSVVHRSTGGEGTVRSIRGTRAEVQFGAMRMTVALQDLLRRTPEPARQSRAISIETPRSSGSVALEVDLRGMRLEEALTELERRLDSALVSGQRVLSVIHGTGTGVLQKGVHQALAVHPAVSSFAYALPEHGGHGCTQVLLK